MKPTFFQFQGATFQLEAIQHVSPVMPANPQGCGDFEFYVIVQAGPARFVYKDEATAQAGAKEFYETMRAKIDGVEKVELSEQTTGQGV